MSKLCIGISKDVLEKYCRKNHIQHLSFFGSVLREDFSQKSDIDALVEFESGHTPGLEFFAMQDELTRILGRRVDLNTINFLNPHFRDQVLHDAVDYFVAWFYPAVSNVRLRQGSSLTFFGTLT